MNLLMISDLCSAGTALAEKLCELHHVTVFHPNPWSLESCFEEKRISPQNLLVKDLSSYGAILVLFSRKLSIQYLECLLERLNQWPSLPCICLSPCSAIPRIGTPSFSAEEALCRLYRTEYNLNVSFVKIPAVYGEDFLPSEMMNSLLQRPSSNQIELHGAADDTFDLLHVFDLASLTECLLINPPSSAHLEIGSAHASFLSDVAEIINAHFCLTEIHYIPDDMPSALAYKGTYPGWMPQHFFLHDLPHVFQNIETLGNLMLSGRHGIQLRWLGRCGIFLLLFSCVCLYTSFIKVSSELQFVDMRLLFVVVVSLYMGRHFGLAAGILASLASVIEAIVAGTRWYVIFFHIDNWIPLAVYLATSVLLGMYSDNHHSRIISEIEP